MQVKMTEATLQANIIHLAEFFGFRVYHVTDVKGKLRASTSVGFPDLVMAKTGRLIFAELKSDKGKLTKEQQTWLVYLERSVEGIETYWWRPKDWLDGTIEKVLTAK